jgi:hypothetical protein
MNEINEWTTQQMNEINKWTTQWMNEVNSINMWMT